MFFFLLSILKKITKNKNKKQNKPHYIKTVHLNPILTTPKTTLNQPNSYSWKEWTNLHYTPLSPHPIKTTNTSPLHPPSIPNQDSNTPIQIPIQIPPDTPTTTLTPITTTTMTLYPPWNSDINPHTTIITTPL